MSTICERRQACSDLKRDQFQMGLPFSSRRTRVSLPRTTSRARMTSASPCLIRAPVRTISSPWLKFTPISSRNAFGQRYVECVCPIFHQQIGNLFFTTSNTENSEKQASSSNACNGSYKQQHDVRHCNCLSYWGCT